MQEICHAAEQAYEIRYPPATTRTEHRRECAYPPSTQVPRRGDTETPAGLAVSPSNRQEETPAP